MILVGHLMAKSGMFAHDPAARAKYTIKVTSFNRESKRERGERVFVNLEVHKHS